MGQVTNIHGHQASPFPGLLASGVTGRDEDARNQWFERILNGIFSLADIPHLEAMQHHANLVTRYSARFLLKIFESYATLRDGTIAARIVLIEGVLRDFRGLSAAGGSTL